MRGLVLLCVATVLFLGLHPAHGQSYSDVTSFSGIEKVQEVFVAKDGSVHVLAVLPKKGGFAMMNSTQPKRRVHLPPAYRPFHGWIHEVPTHGVVVTWRVEGKVHRVSSTTGKTVFTRPYPAGMPTAGKSTISTTPGADGSVLHVGTTEVDGKQKIVSAIVVDVDGKEHVLDPAVLTAAREVKWATGNTYLIINESDRSWHYSLKERRRATSPGLPVAEGPPLRQSQQPYQRVAYVRRSESKDTLSVYSDKVLVLVIEGAGHAFAVVNDGITFVRKAGDVFRVHRVEFPGGLTAWAQARRPEVEKASEAEKVATAKAAEAAAAQKELADRQRALTAQEDRKRKETQQRRDQDAWAAKADADLRARTAAPQKDLPIETVVRSVLARAKQDGMTLQSSEWGPSSRRSPIRMKQKLRGLFIVVAIVHPVAPTTQIAVRGENRDVQLSFEEQRTDEGWHANHAIFSTGNESINVVIEGGSLGDRSAATAILLFTKD